MRRVRKPWPPKANVRPVNQSPATLGQAEKQFRADLESVGDQQAFARATFDDLKTEALRDCLRADQKQICVYCERSISDKSPTRIEHWRPVRGEPSLALHWKNLYLSCASDHSCDVAKKYRPLRWDDADPDLPWPCDCDYEEHVGFTSAGNMYVRSDRNVPDAFLNGLCVAISDHEVAGRRQLSIVGLNHPSLVAERAAKLDREKTRLERRFPGTHASREERRLIAEGLLESDPLPEFVSIRVAWLRKTLGVGR